MSIDETVELIEELENYRRTHRLEFYEPYDYQKKFHGAISQEGTLARQRALMAANQIGKTFCGAMETAFHLTGLYPEWWTGHRFEKAVEFDLEGGVGLRAPVGLLEFKHERHEGFGDEAAAIDAEQPLFIGAGPIGIDLGHRHGEPSNVPTGWPQ